MLFTTSFSENEIVQTVNLTAAYIKTQREEFFERAQPLADVELEIFRPFFSEALLKTTRFIRKTDGPIQAPEFLKELNDRGVSYSLDRLEAVNFMDVVVSYRELEPKVRFHELVHAVQYQKMGLKQFANKYVRGLLSRGSYEKIPLEANARLLDETFSKDPAQAFSVEQEVQRWINENKF